MADYPDWRLSPPTYECASCGAAKHACRNRRGFSGRPCCESCAHPTRSEVERAS